MGCHGIKRNDTVPVTVLRKPEFRVSPQALRVPRSVPSPVRAPSHGTPQPSRLCCSALSALSSPSAGLSFNGQASPTPSCCLRDTRLPSQIVSQCVICICLACLFLPTTTSAPFSLVRPVSPCPAQCVVHSRCSTHVGRVGDQVDQALLPFCRTGHEVHRV